MAAALEEVSRKPVTLSHKEKVNAVSMAARRPLLFGHRKKSKTVKKRLSAIESKLGQEDPVDTLAKLATVLLDLSPAKKEKVAPALRAVIKKHEPEIRIHLREVAIDKAMDNTLSPEHSVRRVGAVFVGFQIESNKIDASNKDREELSVLATEILVDTLDELEKLRPAAAASVKKNGSFNMSSLMRALKGL